MRWILDYNNLWENVVKLMVLQQTFWFQMAGEMAPTENNSWISSLFRSCTEAAKRRVVWVLFLQELFKFLKCIVWKMMVHKLVRLQGSSLPSVSIADMLTVYMEFMCPFTLLFMGKHVVTLQLPHHMLLILPHSYRAPSSRKYTYIKKLCIF